MTPNTSGAYPGTPRRRRRRSRWVPLVLVLTPVVEVTTIVLIARWLGVGPTIGILLAETVLGGWLVIREVPRTWRALREGLGWGTVEVEGVRIARAPTRLPAKELADGALVLIGGALLLLPGFVSDLLALVCLIPFTRPLPRRFLTAALARRAGDVTDRLRTQAERERPVPGEVMEGTVLEAAPDDPDDPMRKRPGAGG